MAYTIPSARTTDWASYCGVPGGIPNRETIYTTLTDGATVTQINAAIAACPEDQVVYLGAGTYNVGATSITFGTKSNVTLRGAGAGQTIITGTATYITNTSRYFYEARGIAIANDSGLNKGSTSITLSASPSAGFYVGNLMMITQEDDAVLNYHAYLTEASPGIGTMSGTRNMRFTTRITQVSGNTITFASPIPYGFTYSLNPKAYPMTNSIGAVVAHTTLCGVEDLTLDSTGGLANSVFSFTGADRCWVKDIEATGFRSSRGGVIFAWSVQCEANGCYLHDGNNYPANSEGYGFFLDYGTTHFKLEDCITRQLSAGYQSCGTTACATLYCYDIDSRRASFTWLQPSFNYNHGPCGLMNLFEGNIGQKFQSDGYHGSTSHTTLFRNVASGTRTVIANPRLGVIDLCRGSYYENVVGNILGDPSWTPSYYLFPVGGSPVSAIYNLGFSDSDSTSFTLNNPTSTHRFVGWDKALYEPDADVEATLIRHANYDYYSDAVIYSDADHAIADSLFYASKPSWFGTLSWPPIDPFTPTANTIPAKWRWDKYVSTADFNYLFTDDIGETTGFVLSFDARMVVSESETARLYVEYPYKRVVTGTSAVYTVHVEPYNDFTANATLDVTGLPTNATDSYGTNPIAYTASTNVTIATTGVSAGTYSMYITGTATGGEVGSARIILEVVASDDCAPKLPVRRIRVKQGENAVFTVQADPTEGYTGNMDLSASGVPTGATGTFADTEIAYNESTTFTVDSGTAAVGEHEITITGEGPA